MKSAAMRSAKSRQSAFLSPDAPPLAPHEERSLIEAAAELSSTSPDPAQMAAGGTAQRPWTVSQVNTCLNNLLTDALPPAFFIQGEISNFRTYDRGHAFFTLKDPSAELPCVIWKDALARLKFKPKDGLAVIVKGAIRLYEPQGKIQIYVDTILPQGAGALELAFRQLCDKLRDEGLFEPARKRSLPKLPQTIAIITSRTGDVLHDVLTTAYRRFPGLHTLLYPVRVQGKEAAPDIIRAIQNLNSHNTSLSPQPSSFSPIPRIDLILLVRGGGSLEDLWPFNDESLARAIVASAIPIATGIGHEPDTTIADLVGDLRGPTPTGITELTIPDVRALSADLASKSALLSRDLRRLLDLSSATLDRTRLHFTTGFAESLRNRRQRLDLLCRHVERIEPRHAIAQGWRRVEEAAHRLERASPRLHIQRHRDRLDHLRTRLHTALLARTAAATQRIAALSDHLRLVSPQSILDRGYSITTHQDGTIIRSTAQVKKGDLLTTRLADGEITSTVGKPKQSSLF
jgi:exodeoxyribonuclease VII large subunit